MRCPRCKSEHDGRAARCARCGAPLALGREPAPASLDQPLSLDRRLPRPADPLASAAGPPSGSRGPGVVPASPARAVLAVAAAVAPARSPAYDPTLDITVDAVEVHLRRAPTHRRIAAWMIDGALLAGLGALSCAALSLSGPGGGLAAAVVLVAGNARLAVPVGAFLALAAVVYSTLGHALMGATLGKRLLGLEVVGRDGRRPTIARAAVRSVLALASVSALLLGFLLALFTRSGRAAHDFLAGTYVVRAP